MWAHKRCAIKKTQCCWPVAHVVVGGGGGSDDAAACLLVSYSIFLRSHLLQSKNWMHNSNKSVCWQVYTHVCRQTGELARIVCNCILGPISLFLLFTTFQKKIISHFLLRFSVVCSLTNLSTYATHIQSE